ncbi:splicing factor 1 [Sporothrix brasiliensis 5110]|uniref:Branchpoint-bridging protein n=1 Tax=Sporothrix brasiliensis 5110 TaxID=1398154 RepID=A0A0C2INB1_9PEZI|nr:splicing factor 1 [Sporothrix brasiliensis 5110]KIH88470.1 splicing factor 1 [Sporothrix brasiliensis 5110]
MSWRNQGITGSNNIPLGKVRRFGGDSEPSSNGGGGDYDRGDRHDRSDYRSDRGDRDDRDRNGGGYDRDRDLKRGRSPEPRGPPATDGGLDGGVRRRKKRNRWGEASDNKAAGLMGLPTAILANMTSEQLEAYTLHLRIEEITQKLKIDDVVPADGDRSPSPAPQYDNHGRRINTREYRYRKKLEEERHKLVEKAIKTFPNYHPPQDYRRPTKTQEKVYVPVNDYPEINFKSGAKIAIRGKGSVKEGKGRSDAAHSSNQEEDLHCLIMADTEEKVEKAKRLIHNVIETVCAHYERLKQLIQQLFPHATPRANRFLLQQAASIPEGQNELKRNQLRELAALNGTLRDDENQACQNCGQIGHRKYDCPEKQNYTANIICRVCGNAGHMARDCPDRQRGANWRNDGPVRSSAGRLGPSGSGDAVDREYEQLMQELGGGSGPPLRIEAGPGGPSGPGGGNSEPKPWQRGPTGGPAPWRRANNDRDNDGPPKDAPGGPSGGPAPWARDRNYRNNDSYNGGGGGYDNGGGDFYNAGSGAHGGYNGQNGTAAPPAPPGMAPWHQAPGAQAIPPPPSYHGSPGYGAPPGMGGAPPGLHPPPPPPGAGAGAGLGAPPGMDSGLSALIQQYSGAVQPPPPPPPPGDAPPPPPPSDQPPPPPPPGA